jgi:D-3-phosphoglycerate dehydrogenase / 2-oxoglutarate reductase
VTEKLVLVTDYTWESTDAEAEVLRLVGAELLVAQTSDEEELIRLVPNVDAILTCFAHVTGNVIRAGHKLQVIGRYGIGVDNIDVDEATRRGIVVTNVPVYCLDEVTDHAMALLLACARNICAYNSAVRLGDWRLSANRRVHRVRGLALGVIGLGNIGRMLVRKAQAFGLRVLVHDPHVPFEQISELGAVPLELDQLLSEADFVSVHVPLTSETHHLIDSGKLRLMKPGAFLINTSRGGIINLEDLGLALIKGWIAGAALDVFEPERLETDHPLLAAPNLIVTPHAAFYSEESLLELERKAAANVAQVLSGHRPESIVNPQVLELERWSRLAAPM